MNSGLLWPCCSVPLKCCPETERPAEDSWQPTLERMQRNLKRLIDIEDQVYDILEKKTFHHTPVFRLIFEECEDMLEALIAEKQVIQG